MNVGDPIRYVTDTAYKYRGYRFRVKEIREDGSVLIGNRDGLVDVVIGKDCLDCITVVKVPHNRAVYDGGV